VCVSLDPPLPRFFEVTTDLSGSRGASTEGLFLTVNRVGRASTRIREKSRTSSALYFTDAGGRPCKSPFISSSLASMLARAARPSQVG
jgi:hypothetical protein